MFATYIQHDHHHIILFIIEERTELMDRQILWDCHMHSSFSADSDTPMESMIQRAIELSIQGITIT